MNNKIAYLLLSILFAACPFTAQYAQDSEKKKVFTFTNNSGEIANDFHVVLSHATKPMNIDTGKDKIKRVDGVFANYPTEGKSPQDYKEGSVAKGGSLTLQFEDETKVRQWWWTKDGKRVGEIQTGQSTDLVEAPQGSGGDALVFSATGTGRTTGHIADLSVFNPSDRAVTLTLPPCLIPGNGLYQPYLVPNFPPVSIAPHATANVQLNGYCADIFTAPVPAGRPFPVPATWLPATAPASGWRPDPTLGWTPLASIPGQTGPLFPGTEAPLGHSIDIARHPAEAAPLLLDALQHITGAYDALHQDGIISTPFSGNPEKERESVIQQTFWIYAAELGGKHYTSDEFRGNTIRQFETATGQSFSKAAPEQKKQVEQGVQDFWNSFEAVGVEAKVLTTRKP